MWLLYKIACLVYTLVYKDRKRGMREVICVFADCKHIPKFDNVKRIIYERFWRRENQKNVRT